MNSKIKSLIYFQKQEICLTEDFQSISFNLYIKCSQLHTTVTIKTNPTFEEEKAILNLTFSDYKNIIKVIKNCFNTTTKKEEVIEKVLSDNLKIKFFTREQLKVIDKKFYLTPIKIVDLIFGYEETKKIRLYGINEIRIFISARRSLEKQIKDVQNFLFNNILLKFNQEYSLNYTTNRYIKLNRILKNSVFSINIELVKQNLKGNLSRLIISQCELKLIVKHLKKIIEKKSAFPSGETTVEAMENDKFKLELLWNFEIETKWYLQLKKSFNTSWNSFDIFKEQNIVYFFNFLNDLSEYIDFSEKLLKTEEAFYFEINKQIKKKQATMGYISAKAVGCICNRSWFNRKKAFFLTISKLHENKSINRKFIEELYLFILTNEFNHRYKYDRKLKCEAIDQSISKEACCDNSGKQRN